jgi:adenine deaminase
MAVGGLSRETFRLVSPGRRVRAIGIVPDQIETEHVVVDSARNGDEIVADPARDIAKVAVIERHHATGRVGRGLVRGLGLMRGALASSVAHDAHNLVVVGVNDDDMVAAAEGVRAAGGGLSAAAGGQVLAALPLPVAGLMCDRPYRDTAAALATLEEAASTLGDVVRHPFGAISFLALSVIPSLRVTDRGVVDVDRGEVVPLEVS